MAKKPAHAPAFIFDILLLQHPLYKRTCRDLHGFPCVRDLFHKRKRRTTCIGRAPQLHLLVILLAQSIRLENALE